MIRKIAIAGETVTQVCQIVNTMIIAKGMFTWFSTNGFYQADHNSRDYRNYKFERRKQKLVTKGKKTYYNGFACKNCKT